MESFDEQLTKTLGEILRHKTFCRLCERVQVPPHQFRDCLSLELGEARWIDSEPGTLARYHFADIATDIGYQVQAYVTDEIWGACRSVPSTNTRCRRGLSRRRQRGRARPTPTSAYRSAGWGTLRSARLPCPRLRRPDSAYDLTVGRARSCARDRRSQPQVRIGLSNNPLLGRRQAYFEPTAVTDTGSHGPDANAATAVSDRMPGEDTHGAGVPTRRRVMRVHAPT